MLHDPPHLAPDDVLAAALPGLAVARVDTPAPGPWLAGDLAPPFRLTRSAGATCLWHPERVAAIAADLDSAAPLLDRVEAASGWRFEPARSLAGPSPGALLVAVSDDTSTLELALPDAQQLPERLRATAEAAPLRGDRPVSVRLVLSGPALSVDQAAALSPGDLLLLPALAAVRVESRRPALASDALLALELASGQLARSAWADTAEIPSAFAVPVAITLPPVLIAPDLLAGAADGQAVPLGPVREGAEVTLAVGGRPLGAGTIVRLGSRLAVAIAAPAGQESNVK